MKLKKSRYELVYAGKFTNIVYDNKIYGEWNNEANIDYPEDLTLERDLSELIEIGILIGKQMKTDEKE